MHRADAFIGCPLPEEGTGNGFFILAVHDHRKSVSFIRVHGYDTFLAIRVPYPEFVGLICSRMLMISPMVLQQSPQHWHTKVITRHLLFSRLVFRKG